MRLPTVEPGLDEQRRTDRDRPPEVRLELAGHRRTAHQVADRRAERLVERAGQQAAVGEPGGALVGRGDGEPRAHDLALADGRAQVQPGVGLVTAPEALREVHAELGARFRRLRVRDRGLHRHRRPGLRNTTHALTLTRR